MKWYKLVGVVVTAFAVVSMFAGCGGSAQKDSSTSAVEKTSASETKGKEASIGLFTRFSDGASKTFFDEAAASFHEKYQNITIKVSSSNNANYKQEINVKLASNDAPDIYFAWSGVYAKNFVDGGRALDLTSYINNNKDWSGKIISNQFGPFTFNDKIYGIPLIMDGKTFYYNQDIFNKLGLKVPENWDEFISVLKTLKEKSYIPISLGNQEDWATGHYMTTLNQRMVAADTLAKDYSLSGDFSDPAYVKALDKLQELVPYFTPNFNSTSYDTGINDFISGKAAIYYEQFNQVQYIAPAKFNWSWFDFPDIKEGAGDQNALTGAPQGLMVSAATKNPDAAMQFLMYLTSPEVASKMVKDTKMISCVDGAITKDTADEKLMKIAETIKSASSINLWLDNAMNSEVVTAYLADIQAMAGGNMKAEDVMADVRKKATEVKAELK
jgi:ABC-type sugar transport system, periplasmic component